MYWAPEVTNALGPHTRGRAVDMFALGCIFLEIATVLSGFLYFRGLSTFAEFRESSHSQAFGRCPGKLFQWMRFLWASVGTSFLMPFWILNQLVNLSFMLDSNPKMRITARQLVALL